MTLLKKLVAGLSSLLNSLVLLKEAKASWKALRASCRWGGRGVCWDLGREELGYRKVETGGLSRRMFSQQHQEIQPIL